MLDWISRGRVILGLGIGHQVPDFEAYGVDRTARVEITEEVDRDPRQVLQRRAVHVHRRALQRLGRDHAALVHDAASADLDGLTLRRRPAPRRTSGRPLDLRSRAQRRGRRPTGRDATARRPRRSAVRPRSRCSAKAGWASRAPSASASGRPTRSRSTACITTSASTTRSSSRGSTRSRRGPTSRSTGWRPAGSCTASPDEVVTTLQEWGEITGRRLRRPADAPPRRPVARRDPRSHSPLRRRSHSEDQLRPRRSSW